MRYGLIPSMGLLMFAALASGQSKSEEDKNADRAQIVSTAEILKVDAKKKTLQVRQLAEPVTVPRAGQQGQRQGRSGGGGQRRTGGGGGGGGGRRRGGGGVGFPGGGIPGGGNGPNAGGGGGSGTTKEKEFKVFINKSTALKFAGANLNFTDLHVSDRITISGFPKGGKGDIDAATITRQ